VALRVHGWLVERHDDHFSTTTPDDELLQAVAEQNWVFITQDRRMRKRPAEREALMSKGLRTFALASTANLSSVETLEVLLRAERAIRNVLANEEGPFVYSIHRDGSLHRLI
jgi:PIN like domain